MNALVVFYSRTGTTKKLGKDISGFLKCDYEEIIDTKNRKGVWGYLVSGRDAMQRRTTKIKKTEKNPAEYDIVIIGTPVWAHNVSPPVRTYIEKNKNAFKNVAFFCTQGGSGSDATFRDMARICRKKPLARLVLLTKEVHKDCSAKINAFVKEINQKTNKS